MSLSQLFSYPFMQRALIAGTLVSLCCALLGVSLVLKRYSMIGDGLSHVSFGALAVAVALGFTPLYFSIPVVVAAAFFLLRMANHPGWNNDAAIAVMSASALSIGILVISLTTGMTTDVDNYMFGSVLAMTPSDVGFSAGLSAAVLALFVLLYHRLFAITFDEKLFPRHWTAGGLLQYAALRFDGADHCAGNADDGRHANLLADHLPRPHRYAVIQKFPCRRHLRRHFRRGVLRRGSDRVLCPLHAGGRHRGNRGSGCFFGSLPDLAREKQLTNKE